MAFWSARGSPVRFLYYGATREVLAVVRMGFSSAASLQLDDWTISDEGLAAMGGRGNEKAALVNRLGAAADPDGIQRNWK